MWPKNHYQKKRMQKRQKFIIKLAAVSNLLLDKENGGIQVTHDVVAFETVQGISKLEIG